MTDRPDPHERPIRTPLSRTARRRALARRRSQVRRRRAVAVLAVGLALITILLLTAGGGGGATRRDQTKAAVAGRSRSARSNRAARAAVLVDREGSAIDRLLARQQFIVAGGSERREIALTFDDGPGPYTPKLLDQLERLHVPATFFEIGFMIHYFNDSLERELRTRRGDRRPHRTAPDDGAPARRPAEHPDHHPDPAAASLRRAVPPPVPTTLRIVQRRDVHDPASASHADGPLERRHRRLSSPRRHHDRRTRARGR